LWGDLSASASSIDPARITPNHLYGLIVSLSNDRRPRVHTCLDNLDTNGLLDT